MNARAEAVHQVVDSDVSRLRVPPHSVEAEQSVLGGLLIDNLAWDRAGDLLTDADFYRHEHRLIYAAIGALVGQSKPADVVTVFERLGGKANEIGGLAYLNALAQSVPSAANMRRYAEIVRERSILRRVIAASDEVSTAAFAEGADAHAVLDQATSAFGQLDRLGQRAQPKPISALIVAAVDRYQAFLDGSLDVSKLAIPTGIGPLDRLLNGGLRAGKVYGLAARPSVGKSAAGRQFALHSAKLGNPTLLLSMEMPDDEVADCIVAQVAGIDSERVQTGRFDEHEGWARLTDAVEEMRGWPLFVDEQGGLTLGEIRAKARSIKGLRVLVVNYLQLSRSTLRNATTNDQIAEISKGLKALAMELKVSVVVLSQLNRDVEKRPDREPQLSDLRDSGAIEQDLDVAVMLWTVREDEDGIDRLVGWKVAKHRGGRKGRFGMRFDAPRYRWRETAESIESPAKAARGGDL
jgi:replicative DNA helicase